jgi:fumarylacetoacetase
MDRTNRAAVLNETHDPTARSLVQSANDDAAFPIQNLPFGVFRENLGARSRIGIAIGNCVLDLSAIWRKGLLSDLADLVPAILAPNLHKLMERGQQDTSRIRHRLFKLLRDTNPAPRLVLDCLLPVNEVEMLLPCPIGNFTDFFTSIHHARRTGELARPGNPLFPNFKSLPVAYHGRASSVVVSGTPCIRPRGQLGAPEGQSRYQPSRRVDFELELGCFIHSGNRLGSPISMDAVEEFVFGVCLVNDWSARDIQRWESQPLGPFLAKSFMTSISPWVVTLEALAPFRIPPAQREPDDPPLAKELCADWHNATGGIDISFEVLLSTREMRSRAMEARPITRTAFREQYWSLFQMIVHHTSNGCNLQAGDLIASGTISGADPRESGCLLELTQGGQPSVELPTGEKRGYLEDGDCVTFEAICQRDGFRSIGLGSVTGRVAPRSGE